MTENLQFIYSVLCDRKVIDPNAGCRYSTHMIPFLPNVVSSSSPHLTFHTFSSAICQYGQVLLIKIVETILIGLSTICLVSSSSPTHGDHSLVTIYHWHPLSRPVLFLQEGMLLLIQMCIRWVWSFPPLDFIQCLYVDDLSLGLTLGNFLPLSTRSPPYNWTTSFSTLHPRSLRYWFWQSTG
jgi:hypothetical protein